MRHSRLLSSAFVLLAACDDPRTSISRYREALPSGTQAQSSDAGCGTCPTGQQCVSGRCEKIPSDVALSPPTVAPAPPPAASPSTVAETLRPSCSVDSQCPQPSTCVVPVCSSGLCTTKARSCDDSNAATLDVCVDTVGCENKPEPSNLKVVDSCANLPKSVVCGADGVNYYNPCSAHNSAQVQYSTAPCRAANTYCSDNTAACLKGTRCVNHLCK